MRRLPQDKNSVKILKRKLVAENSKWRVFFDHIRAENGFEVPDYLVVQHKVRANGNITGVGILPIVGEKIILQKAFRYPLNASFWEMPRGMVDSGEDPKVSAIRELEEESGLICSSDDLFFIGNVAAETSTLAGLGALFIAFNCKWGGSRDLEEPGLGECQSFSPKQVYSMIFQNEIHEAHTLIALNRYLLDYFYQRDM